MNSRSTHVYEGERTATAPRILFLLAAFRWNIAFLKNKIVWAWRLGGWPFFLCTALLGGVARAEGEHRVYDAVMEEFAKHDNRLVGSADYAQCLGKLEGVLTAAGLKVHRQTFFTESPRTKVSRLLVGETEVGPVYPLAPNGIAPPTTWGKPVKGPVVYVGDGSLAALDGKHIEGAIAVMEIDSPEPNVVFYQGARAVVLVGNDHMSQWLIDQQFTILPVGVPRVYVDRKTAQEAGLLSADGSREASLEVAVTWQPVEAANLWVKIEAPGAPADPDERAQALVLSGTTDTFGAVPDLDPELRSAANVALLAQVAANLAHAPVTRSIYAVFFGSHYAAQDGARHFYYVVDRATKGDAESLATLQRDLYEKQVDQPRRELGLLDPATFVTGKSKDEFDVYIQAKRKLVARVNDLSYDLRSNVLARRAIEKKLQLGDVHEDASQLRARLEELAGQEKEMRLAKGRYNGLRGQLATLAITDPEGFAGLVADLRSDLESRRSHFATMVQESESFRELETALKAGGSTTEAIAGHFDFDFGSPEAHWMFSPFGANAWSRNVEVTPGTFARQLKAYLDVYRSVPQRDALAHLWVPDSSVAFRFDALATPHQRSAPSMTALGLGIAGFQLQTIGASLDADGLPVREPADLAGLAPELTSFMGALAKAPHLPAKTDFNAIDRVPRLEPKASGDDIDGLEIDDLVKGSEDVQAPARDALLYLAQFNHDVAGVEPRYDIGGPNIIMARAWPTGHVFAPGVGATYPYGQTPDHINAIGFDSNGGINRFTVWQKSKESRAPLHFGFGGAFFTPLNPMDYNFGTVGRWLIARSDSDPRFKLELAYRDKEVFYQDQPYPFKFVGNGVNTLGSTPQDPGGTGLPFDPGSMISLDMNRQAAHDYAILNLARLKTLRSRNIINKQLEKLQADAVDHLEHAAEARAQGRIRLAAAHETVANVLGHRVQKPLRESVNDLVQAVVILLFLCIPFAFSIERLVFGFTSIYRQIAGFVGIFLLTFGILYVSHPAFSLASAPIIVFLAFVIILLSSFVIYVVMDRFKQEIRALQGLASKVHGGQSEGGTALAAVAIGISGMRNRPLKTFLTAVTVALLTFTILVFASFSSSQGVVTTYLGAAHGQPRIEFHTPSFMDIPYRLRDAVSALYADRYDVFVRGASFKDPLMDESKDDVINVAYNPKTEASQLLDGILVVDPGEAQHLGPIFAPLLAEPPSIPPLLIPRVLADKLGAEVGSLVQIRGQAFRVESIFDSAALKRLENIDGSKGVPPDFKATFAASGAHSDNATNLKSAVQGLDVSSFLFSSPDLTAITTFDGMKKLGVLHNLITLYPRAGAAIEADARELAELVEGPVVASTDQGSQRFFFTTAFQGSGFLEVIVPLLLGGLIIFSSLLGSIVDRQREIFTFSALGLAPPDVGALFFAESAVFAIIGGMGGYLISQLVVKVLSILSAYGLADVPDINFSSFSSIMTILIVMATVMLSTIYPAIVAGRSANPGVARKWKMPKPRGNQMTFTFPFTVSADNIRGILAFIHEHFDNHGDASLGSFAARDIRITRAARAGGGVDMGISAEIALAPFDLGVFQRFAMSTRPSDIAGIDEVVVDLERRNGAPTAWLRGNRAFIDDLREQFLRWRSLPLESIEHYHALAERALFTEGSTHAA